MYALYIKNGFNECSLYSFIYCKPFVWALTLPREGLSDVSVYILYSVISD